MGVLLTNGFVVDPIAKSVTRQDILLEGDRIVAMGVALPRGNHQVRDLTDLYVLPGLIDVHVHLREPGYTHKETIATGTMAAAAGGFSQICPMPNTSPVTDDPEIVRYVIEEAKRHGYAQVHPIAAVTKGLRGEELTDFQALYEAGAIAFSDDGRGVQSAEMMKKALLAAKKLNSLIAVHAEDETLSKKGVMHEGEISRLLGVEGIPTEAESVMIARDIVLAKATGAHVHICHVSPESAVSLIADAKRRGVRVTGEVAPHHLLLNDQVVKQLGTHGKVNPPLRDEIDRLACVRGFLDGTLDVIATDHAPHSEEEKAQSLEKAPNGFTGIEISLPLLYTSFVHSGLMTLAELVERMSTLPAKLFHLDGGQLAIGSRADLTVLDPYTPRIVNPRKFKSKGKVTPFAGRSLYGWPILTYHAGNLVHDSMA